MLNDPRPGDRETEGNAQRRRLSLLLRSAMFQGDFADDRLPREPDLMRDYAVSRGVVRDVLRQLSVAGAVSRASGIGTRRTAAGSAPHVIDASGNDPLAGWPRRVRMLERSVIPTPPAIAARMPSAGATVLRVEFLVAAGEAPCAVTTCYFALPAAAALETVAIDDLRDAFAAAELRPAGAEHLIGAMLADDAVAARLRLRTGEPVLRIDQVLRDEGGVPFCVATTVRRADRGAVLIRSGCPEGDDVLRPRAPQSA